MYLYRAGVFLDVFCTAIPAFHCAARRFGQDTRMDRMGRIGSGRRIVRRDNVLLNPHGSRGAPSLCACPAFALFASLRCNSCPVSASRREFCIFGCDSAALGSLLIAHCGKCLRLRQIAGLARRRGVAEVWRPSGIRNSQFGIRSSLGIVNRQPPSFGGLPEFAIRNSEFATLSGSATGHYCSRRAYCVGP
jgi:hypothetical protein